jgi:hypothetical protein
MTNEERRVLFTEKVTAGSRTYFFDVKESKDETKYLVISESQQSSSGQAHRRVMVFEENLEAFNDGFQKAIQFLGIKNKAYSVEQMRQEYPKAYERWTVDEDERLKARHREGATVTELAKFFQRQDGAIRSRLAKLGLAPNNRNK